MNLPAESKKKVDYWWPVVQEFANIQRKRNNSNVETMEVMKAYMDTKTLLVREKKALLARTKEHLDKEYT